MKGVRVMTREEIQANLDNFKVFNTTIEKIKKAKLLIPTKPTFTDGDLFQEWEELKRKYGGIANIPYEELGEFLDKWTAFIAYARWCEAIADLEAQTAKEARDTVKNQLYVLQDGSREMKAAQVATEELYLKLEKEYVEKQALYIALKGLREGYEQRATAISREITRRIAERERY